MRALPPAIIGVMVFQIALIVGALVLGSVLLGIFLDLQLGTKPMLTLGLGIVSLPISVWLTYRIALRTIAKARASYEAYEQSKRAKQAGRADNADARESASAPALGSER